MVAAIFLRVCCQEQCGSPSTSKRSLRIARLVAFVQTIALAVELFGPELFMAFERVAEI